MTPLFTPDERELIMRTRVALNTAAMRAQIAANQRMSNSMATINGVFADIDAKRIQAAQNALEELV